MLLLGSGMTGLCGAGIEGRGRPSGETPPGSPPPPRLASASVVPLLCHSPKTSTPKFPPGRNSWATSHSGPATLRIFQRLGYTGAW